MSEDVYDPMRAYGKPIADNPDTLLDSPLIPTYGKIAALQTALKEARTAAHYWETQYGGIREQMMDQINRLDEELATTRRQLADLRKFHQAVKEVLGNRTADRDKWRKQARNTEGLIRKLREDVTYWQNAYDRSEKRVIKLQDRQNG